jgi:hypothetical protein
MQTEVLGFMRRLKIVRPLPVSIIYPEGGEPLYEEVGTGLRLTASDFAARHGYENTSKFLEAINDRRTTSTDDNQDSSTI